MTSGVADWSLQLLGVRTFRTAQEIERAVEAVKLEKMKDCEGNPRDIDIY